jgi:hypothetical protein
MSASDRTIYQLHEVFVKSGLPGVTYVEPDDAILLKLALMQPVRVVIVEGPPGSGKTVTTRKIIHHSTINNQNPPIHIQKFLNPSIQKDLQDIRTLQEWHNGPVVIDSFHNLDLNMRKELTHYLIDLVNNIDGDKKLIIIGTPLVHQRLIDAPPQFSSMLEFYRFQKADNAQVEQLIKQGEEALNVKFEEKEQIVQAAFGSLNLAQRLCYDLCALAQVTQTQEQTKNIPLQMNKALKQTMLYLDYRFAKAIKSFISHGRSDDTICLHFLQKLALAADASLSLPHIKANAPSRAYEIERFIGECWIDRFHERHPEAVNYLFFERPSQKLIIDDPQLSFYLKYKDLSTIAQEVGKILKRPQLFISYSHRDTDCMERLMMHLKPIERELIIDTWIDTKIEGGQIWKEEIEHALNAAKAAILLISAPFWASDFITKYELPTLLANAKAKGTKIIPVILSASDFDHTEVQRFQSINAPNNPVRGPGKTEYDWDIIFVKVVYLLREYFREI